jgi:RHS repeat-associated protein
VQISLAYFTKTYYLRDAQGNIMATYEREYEDDAPDMLMNFSLTERAIYGSSRVANNTEEVLLVSQTIGSTSTTTNYFDNPEILSHTNGYKHFELTNHASTPLSTGLDNVMAVVSDKRTPVITGSEITGYTPELLIAKDYYPFGMEMSGRYDVDLGTEPDDEYRFGFQNQEKDDEWTGQTGSHLNYKYRMYDARIGRFFAIDPLAAKYPYYSTYAFSGNRVIDAVELEGLEPVQYNSARQSYAYYNRPYSGLPTGTITRYSYTPQTQREIVYEPHIYLVNANNTESSYTSSQTNMIHNRVFTQVTYFGLLNDNIRQFYNNMAELSVLKNINVTAYHYNKTGITDYRVSFEFKDKNAQYNFENAQREWEKNYQNEVNSIPKPERDSYDMQESYDKAMFDYYNKLAGVIIKVGPSPQQKLEQKIIESTKTMSGTTENMPEIRQTQ